MHKYMRLSIPLVAYTRQHLGALRYDGLFDVEYLYGTLYSSISKCYGQRLQCDVDMPHLPGSHVKFHDHLLLVQAFAVVFR